MKKQNHTKRIHLYFVRHGKTILNQLERLQGKSDSPLTEEGRMVTIDTALGLEDISFDFVYTSDLIRTNETASLILQHHHQTELPILKHPGLREIGFGSMEADLNQLYWKKLNTHMGANEYDELWKQFSPNQVFKELKAMDQEAESLEEIQTRLHQALTDIVKNCEGKGKDPQNTHVLVVSHGAAISILFHFLGFEEKGALENTSISVLTYENGTYCKQSFNDTSYREIGKQKRSDSLSIIIVPSAETIIEKSGRLQGFIDGPITNDGMKKVKHISKCLQDISFDSAYCSDFIRSRDTARMIVEKKSVDIHELPSLRNLSFGSFEACLISEVPNELTPLFSPDQIEKFTTATIQMRLLDSLRIAEDFHGMSARIMHAFLQICESAIVKGEKNILIVLDQAAMLALLHFWNTNIRQKNFYHIKYDGTYRLLD